MFLKVTSTVYGGDHPDQQRGEETLQSCFSSAATVQI